VELTLLLASGDQPTATLDVAAHERADLVIATWDGDVETDEARTLRALMTGSPCPVVVVPRP
jgi:hypothetical protein